MKNEHRLPEHPTYIEDSKICVYVLKIKSKKIDYILGDNKSLIEKQVTLSELFELYKNEYFAIFLSLSDLKKFLIFQCDLQYYETIAWCNEKAIRDEKRWWGDEEYKRCDNELVLINTKKAEIEKLITFEHFKNFIEK